MHYGEFGTQYFLFLAEREAYSPLSDAGEDDSGKLAYVDSTFPLPFALALAAIAIATIAAALWHL